MIWLALAIGGWTAWADLRTRRIPRRALAFGWGAVAGWRLATHALGAGLAGAGLWGAVGWGLALATDGFGGGDARLLALWGAWGGPVGGGMVVAGGALLHLLAGAVRGIQTRRWNPALPFAPALAAAALAAAALAPALLR